MGRGGVALFPNRTVCTALPESSSGPYSKLWSPLPQPHQPLSSGVGGRQRALFAPARPLCFSSSAARLHRPGAGLAPGQDQAEFGGHGPREAGVVPTLERGGTLRLRLSLTLDKSNLEETSAGSPLPRPNSRPPNSGARGGVSQQLWVCGTRTFCAGAVSYAHPFGKPCLELLFMLPPAPNCLI